MQPERRRAERIATGSIAYIHLAPDNGGIVLNISEDGLAFHSAAPVQQDGAVDFWISLSANERIEGTGELAWTNANGKTAGLRLTALSDQARQQILTWLRHPSDGAGSSATVLSLSQGTPEPAHQPVPDNPPVSVEPSAEIAQPPISLAPIVTGTITSDAGILPELKAPANELATHHAGTKKAITAAPIVARSAIAAPYRASPRPGRTVRVISVLIVLGVIGAGIRYRNEVGVLLIYLGNQLVHTSKSKNHQPGPSLSSAPTLQASAPLFPALSTEEQQQLTAEIAEFDRENHDEEVRQADVQAHRRKPSVARSHAPPVGTRDAIAKPLFSAANERDDSLFAEDSHNRTSVDTSDYSTGGGAATSDGVSGPNPEYSAVQIGRQNSDIANSVDARYLDVGNSKDMSWADQTATALLNMGFNVTVDHKGHLWMSSYHVLVGPYSTDQNLDEASEILKSHGFSSRYAKR